MGRFEAAFEKAGYIDQEQGVVNRMHVTSGHVVVA